MVFRFWSAPPPPPPPPPPSWLRLWLSASPASPLHEPDVAIVLGTTACFLLATLFFWHRRPFNRLRASALGEAGGTGDSEDTGIDGLDAGGHRTGELPRAPRLVCLSCGASDHTSRVCTRLGPCNTKNCPCTFGGDCIFAHAGKPHNVRNAAGRRVSARVYETLLRKHKELHPASYAHPVAGAARTAATVVDEEASKQDRKAAKRAARKAARKASARVKAGARAAASAAASEERTALLQRAEAEAERLLAEARARAAALEAEAAHAAHAVEAHAAAARAREESAAAVSRRQRAQLMEAHSNVARSVLAEELRVLDEEAREEREEAAAAEAAARAAAVDAARRALDEAEASRTRAITAEREAARVLAVARARVASGQVPSTAVGAPAGQEDARRGGEEEEEEEEDGEPYYSSDDDEAGSSGDEAARTHLLDERDRLSEATVDAWTAAALDVEESLQTTLHRVTSKAARRG